MTMSCMFQLPQKVGRTKRRVGMMIRAAPAAVGAYSSLFWKEESRRKMAERRQIPWIYEDRPTNGSAAKAEKVLR